jgi:fructose-bisphosphate aldolase class 1
MPPIKDGIEAIVAQQFEVGQQILGHGLVPILEPEVTISIADKAEAEDIAAGLDPEAISTSRLRTSRSC